jgi:hypothetical protein
MSDTNYAEANALGLRIEAAQREAKGRRDRFHSELTEMAAPYGGVLLTWVGQSHDPGLIASRLIGTDPRAQDYLCAAITSDWILLNLTGHPEQFRNDFQVKIPHRYLGLQQQERIKSEEFARTYSDIGRTVTEHERATRAYVRVSSRKPNSAELQEIAGQRTYLDRLIRRGLVRLREARATYLLNSPITGTLVAHGKCSDLQAQLGHVAAVPGYYKLGLQCSGGGHAMAFHFGASHGEFRFFDANSGEWRFETPDRLLGFFEAYWRKLYAADYGPNGQFLLARF